MDVRFYSLNARSSYGRSPVKIQPLVKYDTLKHLDAHSTLAVDNVFKVVSGSVWYDVVQFADSLFFAISGRLKEIFESHQISGWSCFPIEIEDSEKRYFAFYPQAVVGRITNMDAINGYETDIHEFDISTWDGADIFTNEDTINVVCTERVKTLLEKNNVQNIEVCKYN